MNALEEMLLKVSGRYHNKIKKACQPLLDHFGINNFSYHKLKNTGAYYCLGNHVEWFDYYFSENFHLIQPHYRHPRNFQTGVSLSQHISNDAYQNFCQIAREQFNIHFGVVLINKIAEGVEFIVLDVNSPDEMSKVLILNELVLIRKFISKLVEENQSLFKLLEDNQVDMQALIGPKFQNADILVTASLPDRKKFCAELGIEMPSNLSIRDDRVLKLLLEGSSAAQIAKSLHLSCRTIEHNLERIKENLACFTKSELIKKARQLEELGYFDGTA